jgi:hypothetical protein
MDLLEIVRVICKRLAPLGWGRLLDRHGLKLDFRTLHNSRRFAAELNRPLTVDRRVPGFEDFWPDGCRAIQPGRPSRSLLYHALASPLVHPVSDGAPGPNAYPTLLELDAIENYIYGKNNKSLADFMPHKKPGTRLVFGVFAYQYRIGARSANGKFASTALSRTGISRVGTARHHYDPIRRSFWPCHENGQDEIAVMPARYAAYLAEERTPESEDAIQGEQPGDEDRNFLFPVHKLFDGDECLRNATVRITFSERHRNDKLNKFHAVTDVPALEGFDINQSPYIRDSNLGDVLVKLKRVGSSVLVVPGPHKRLIRVAVAKNKNSGKKEIARFVVPPRKGDNRYAGSSFQYLDAKFAERRTGPEYINIRHRVNDPVNISQIEDLNRLPWGQFSKTVKDGGYETAQFLDDSCEGCVTATVTGINLGQSGKTNFPAFSMVSAPDFFPLVDQADITDWVQQVLGTGGEREQFAQGGPRPLSERRNCINPSLLRPDAPSAVAFPVRDDGFARIETVTAIIGGKSLSGSHGRPTRDRRFHDPSTTFLPDSASGIFDPGWDTSFSGNDKEGDFLAAFGLGSPFPEDIKLCAALNSFWPSAAPDATRTFALFPPAWQATTSIPLMDIELGLHPRHSAVLARKQKSYVGWDGEYGPYFERGFRFVNHALIDQSDYVSNALKGTISLRPLLKIDAMEVFRRMNAIREAIAVLPEEPRRVSATKLVLISAESVPQWATRSDRGDQRLEGDGFFFIFALFDNKKGSPAQERGRWLRRVKRRYSCQISQSGLCWKLEAKGEAFTFEARQPT